MQKLVRLSFLLVLFVMPAMAQDSTSGASQTAPSSTTTTQTTRTTQTTTRTSVAATKPSKTEISGGFMLHRYYEVSGDTITMPGFYGDVEHNLIQRWLGVEVQGAGGFKNQGVQGNLSIYSLMGGPTFYPFGHRKITFFAHILAGEGYYRNSIPTSVGFPSLVNTHTSFEWAGGAGLDLRLSRRLGVRLIQFDYAETKFMGGTVHENDSRLSIGIVYHF